MGDEVCTVTCGLCEVAVRCERVFGEVLWPAAEPLASWLTGLEISGPILELGCGAGLCALAFAKATGERVVATDFDAVVLELVGRNAELNDLSTVEVRPLELGSSDECRALVQEFGSFPLVVGSDIVYEPGQVSRVLSAAEQLLGSDGRCILAVSDAFRNYVGFLVAHAESKEFEAEVMLCGGTSMVILTRGKPAWRLPVLQVPTPESESRGGNVPDPGCDRADLLFA